MTPVFPDAFSGGYPASAIAARTEAIWQDMQVYGTKEKHL